MQQILILHVYDSDESESKGINTDKKVSQGCSMDDRWAESVIVNESSINESESESVHKIINPKN